jgi:CRISPR/Cas system-associated exonuclease Cas4 (RecB family)
MIAAIDAEPVTPPANFGRSRAELLATVSASRLSAWLGCRLRFYFRYVAGLRKPNSPARHVGTVVHAVLQQWNLARWRRNPLDAEKVQSVFDKAWAPEEGEPIQWEPDEPEDTVKNQALGLIEMYLRETPIPAEERPEAVEASIEMDLGSHGLPTLIGIIDLVRAGGRIVDFKTTGRTPDAQLALHNNAVQLTAYALLYRAATGRKETALELHHLVKNKTPKLVVTESGPASDAQIARFHRLIESYVQGVEKEDYVPAPGIQCAGCEFFNECGRWH